MASSVKPPPAMDLKGVFFVPFHSPFPAVSRSTIFWCSGSFSYFLNFEPSFCTLRLNNPFIPSLLKSNHCPLTYTFFPSFSTRLAKNSFTKAAQPGSLCSPSDCHPLFSNISAKGEISLLNPLSVMKPLSFKLLSIRVIALSEIKFLTLSFLCSALALSAPLFLFLDSSTVC